MLGFKTKELGVSNTDISGLKDGGAFLKQGPGAIPDCRKDLAAVFAPGEEGELANYREIDIRRSISYQGNQQRGMLLTTSSVRTSTSWLLYVGQYHRKYWGKYIGRSALCVRCR